MNALPAPCGWPVTYPQCAAENSKPEPIASLPASGQALYEEMAAAYLWNWTGQSLGVCEVTIRPCPQPCTDGVSTFFGNGPVTRAMYWGPSGLGVSCNRCGDRCGCGGSAGLVIPGPVDHITKVVEDGVTLDPSTYIVQNGNELHRLDGKRWGACDLEITYGLGTQVPPGGQVAAGVLANELAKAACGDTGCQLPRRVQTITRQGVTIAMLDAFDDVEKGHTGIWLIDSWLASVTKPVRRSTVLSPDTTRGPRQRTWPR